MFLRDVFTKSTDLYVVITVPGAWERVVLSCFELKQIYFLRYSFGETPMIFLKAREK